jgi:hypothetical protein
MLLKVSGHILNCLERAADAEHRAVQSTDAGTRRENELLAQSWRHLARSYQFVESLERFLSEPDRTEIAPPEAPVFVEEQPMAPESRTIVRRRRVKHETSFKDRLLKNAQDAREQAAQLPFGAARDRLLQKAKQSEAAANIDTWISSSGPRLPDDSDHAKKPRT